MAETFPIDYASLPLLAPAPDPAATVSVELVQGSLRVTAQPAVLGEVEATFMVGNRRS